ncbi:O-antigen ligase family protein [Anaerolinea thermophila]|uniref:O-antigen polymerase family protein n=1 Tax=Anaerolinea thermophila (strain DSM 14523 / JCM 11388 / NBRC 100420 / UNI-1) TaxID=926569 RepID=E8N1G7_ANATU|nr:O-antigen ligase family protein [Anaerolinea thermophila]BAJ64910.1 O-antigen polymerase family protein [Anaerolinea thermophila UNI-1]
MHSSKVEPRTERLLNVLTTLGVLAGMIFAVGNRLIWASNPQMWAGSLGFFALLSLILLILVGKDPLPRTGLEGVFALGALSWALSLAMSRHIQLGWEHLALMTGYVVLFYGALVLFRRGVLHQRVVDGLLLVSGWVAAMAVAEISWQYQGFWQVVGNNTTLPPFPYRLMSIIGHPNPFMAVMNLYAPLAALNLRLGGTGRRVGAMLWLILYAFSLPFSSSRSGWLGALAVWGVLILLWGWDARMKLWALLRRSWKRMVLVSGVLLVLVTGVILVGVPYFSAHPSHGTGTLTQSRTGIWRYVLQIWQEHPLTGVGVGNFMPAYFDVSRDFPGGFLAPHAHNLYLQVLVEFGVIGFVVFFVFLGKLLFQLGKAWWQTAPESPVRIERAVALASLCSLLAHGIGDDISFSPVIMGGITLIVAMAWEERNGHLPRLPLRSVWLIVPVMLVLGLSARACWVALPAVQASRAYEQGDFIAAAETYQEVLRRSPQDILYRAQAGLAEAWAWQASGDARWLERSREHLENVVAQEPAPAPWHAALAGVYVAEGNLEQAWQALQEARARARNEPSYALYAGWIAEQLGWQEQALTAYREGLRLDPILAGSPFWEETALRRQAREGTAFIQPQPYWQEALSALEAGDISEARRRIAFSRFAGEKGFAPQAVEWRVALAAGEEDWALRAAKTLRDGLERYFSGWRGYNLAGYLNRAVFPADVPPNFLALFPQDGRLDALAWLREQETRAGNCADARRTWQVEQALRRYGSISDLPEAPPCP